MKNPILWGRSLSILPTDIFHFNIQGNISRPTALVYIELYIVGSTAYICMNRVVIGLERGVGMFTGLEQTARGIYDGSQSNGLA
jgi:hypothetical protein